MSNKALILPQLVEIQARRRPSTRRGADRKILSAQDRKCASAQDRNEISAEGQRCANLLRLFLKQGKGISGRINPLPYTSIAEGVSFFNDIAPR